MTRREKQIIRDYVLDFYRGRHADKVTITQDGEVTVYVDPMPNALRAGRIFAGWDTELLREANREAADKSH